MSLRNFYWMVRPLMQILNLCWIQVTLSRSVMQALVRFIIVEVRLKKSSTILFDFLSNPPAAILRAAGRKIPNLSLCNSYLPLCLLRYLLIPPRIIILETESRPLANISSLRPQMYRQVFATMFYIIIWLKTLAYLVFLMMIFFNSISLSYFSIFSKSLLFSICILSSLSYSNCNSFLPCTCLAWSIFRPYFSPWDCTHLYVFWLSLISVTFLVMKLPRASMLLYLATLSSWYFSIILPDEMGFTIKTFIFCLIWFMFLLLYMLSMSSFALISRGCSSGSSSVFSWVLVLYWADWTWRLWLSPFSFLSFWRFRKLLIPKFTTTFRCLSCFSSDVWTATSSDMMNFKYTKGTFFS